MHDIKIQTMTQEVYDRAITSQLDQQIKRISMKL